MDEPVAKRRRKLNTEQLAVLKLLYKFRFGTNDLFAQYFGKKDRSFVFKRLSILLEQGLVGRRFEPSYRLAGKPAAYYLTPVGARLLQERRKSDEPKINVKAIYKDKTVKDDFVLRCLDIFAMYNLYREQYGETLKFFTKADLNHEQYDYFPQPHPDAYVRLRLSGEERQFFIEFFYDKQPFFAAVKKIKNYVEYAESGGWDDTGTALPVYLAVCESQGLQKRLQRRMAASLAESWSEELSMALTSKQLLFGDSSQIWQLAHDPETAVGLVDIEHK